MTVAHIRNEVSIKNAIRHLFFVSDIAKIIPRGIDKIGVSIAIPGKPKFRRILTINLFQEVKTLMVLLG